MDSIFSTNMVKMKVKNCKGLRFRATKNFYVNKSTGEVVETHKLRLLKRQSCTGCTQCGSNLDFLFDVVPDYDQIPIRGSFDQYKDYTIKITEEEIEFVQLDDRVYK